MPKKKEDNFFYKDLYWNLLREILAGNVDMDKKSIVQVWLEFYEKERSKIIDK